MFQWTVDARSLFKFGLIACALLSASCNETDQKISFESHGLHLNDSKIVVQQATVDSLQFASGDQLWLISGAFSEGSQVHSYSITCSENPLKTRPTVIFSSVDLFGGSKGMKNDSLECVLTCENQAIQVTWRKNQQSIYLEAPITSGH